MNNKYIKFKKRATITTNIDEKYLLEKNRFFIMPHRGIKKYKHKYGNACTITKLDPITGEFNSKDVSFITEVYSFDDNRLRFLMDTYKDAKKFDTELHDNGKELPITVIEDSEGKYQTIESISVRNLDSDIKEESFNKDTTVTFMDIKVLRLLYKQLAEKSNKKGL